MTDIWKKGKSPKSVVPRAGYIFALNIILSTALTGLGDLISTELITWSVLYVNATFISVFIFGQRNPDYNKVIKTEIIKRHYEKSKIKDLDVDSVLQELYNIMENQKAFASEDISIGIVANELGITIHQLSEILNKKIKKNFNHFINDYRIEESKKILIEEPDRTITSIALAVGFNTSSSFSTIFSRTTGLAPKDYRKKFIKK
jgi:AraC-like DNA-binding protein